MELRSLRDICVDLAHKGIEILQEMPNADSEFASSMSPGVPGASSDEIAALERTLGRSLPNNFRAVIASYEVGGLEMCGVVFGGPSVCDFLERQLDHPETVWGRWPPIPDHLVVASSAGYVIFVGVNDDRIWACLRDHPIGDKFGIAGDFDRLLRALGTLVLSEAVENEEALASDLAKAVDAKAGAAFWLDRIRGYA